LPVPCLAPFLIEGFLEECREMGSLNEVLEESGFLRVENNWQSRIPVAEENLALAV
jgi:hypothetical protein